ncbi:MAG: DUF2271 domain-containing protein [Pirellulaceae bacterium]|nr:DUF2271 domain-containing protein [Planctomycetales bacterium]
MVRPGWLVALILVSASVSRAEPLHTFHHENVLGTSLEIKVAADDEAIARQAEDRVLAEIDRLAAIYSSYDGTSELRRWLEAKPGVTRLSPELFNLLKLSDQVRDMTDGAFDPRAAEATALWKQAEKDQGVPSASQIDKTLKTMALPAWKYIDATGQIERTDTTTVSFDGMAKGAIIDLACKAAGKIEGVTGVLINIGGDLRITGKLPQQMVTIADPKAPEKKLSEIQISNGAVATSGNYHRGFKVQDRWYSHIIDPRTAQPVDHVISASVLAESAAKADALATAFSVLTVERTLAICQQSHVACLLVTRDGQMVASRNWPATGTNAVATSAHPTSDSGSTSTNGELWPPGAEMKVSFEVNRAGGGRYRRPYIAVWIEDQDDFPVRTLVLWLQTTGPGPRWHRDLRRWYKQDTLRKLVDDTNLIGTISAATKPPGKYDLVWDGKDDLGALVKKGKYTLYIEAAREHGTYQLQSQEIEIGDVARQGEIPGNVEIKTASYSYVMGSNR